MMRNSNASFKIHDTTIRFGHTSIDFKRTSSLKVKNLTQTKISNTLNLSVTEWYLFKKKEIFNRSFILNAEFKIFVQMSIFEQFYFKKCDYKLILQFPVKI